MTKENIQILVGVGAVVLVGAGVLTYLSLKGKAGASIPDKLMEKLSEHNRAEVMKLHPNARKKFAELITRIESKGYKVVITSGYRDFDKQAQLYKENPKNAKAGYSNHNYGYAIDINIIDPKTGNTVLRKDTSKSIWMQSGIVDLAKAMGFEWGGDFKTYHDPIHFYIPREKTTAQMKELVDAGKVDKEGYVLAFSGVHRKPALEFELR